MRSVLNLVLNVLWILTGGIWMAVGWLIAAVLMAITIIGLPWTRAALNIASYTFLPFGRVALPRDVAAGREIWAPARSVRSATSSGWRSPDGGWRSVTWSRRSVWR